jgi:hypothetical protein
MQSTTKIPPDTNSLDTCNSGRLNHGAEGESERSRSERAGAATVVRRTRGHCEEGSEWRRGDGGGNGGTVVMVAKVVARLVQTPHRQTLCRTLFHLRT